MALVLVWYFIVCQVRTAPGSLPAYVMKLLSFCWAGVDLFFVLSGFLIGGILLDQRSAPNYFQAFYARRLLRIFPLYYLLLGSFALLTAFKVGEWSGGFAWLLQDPLPFWFYATYLQNFAMAAAGTHGPHWLGITWSLAIEEQFYIVLPLLVRLLSKRTLVWLLALLVLAAPIVRGAFFSFYPHGPIAGYVLLPARWDALFLGVLGAVAVRNPFVRGWLRGHSLLIRAVVIGCGAVVMALLAKNQGIGSWGMSWFGHTIIAVLSLGLILLATASVSSRTARLFRNPVLMWVGTVSYGIYLIHQPVVGLLHATLLRQSPQIANPTDALVTLLGLGLTFGLAAISWRVFERPLVRLGKQIRYNV